MKHLNGHMMCIVDVETTGTDPAIHEIWDICVLPVNDMLEIDKTVRPFQALLKPLRPENIVDAALRVSGLKKADVINQGNDPWKAADGFEEWFKKLNLPLGKMIVPIAHNWPFDREFLIEWLGRKSFEAYFHGFYRDTMMMALFHNDRMSFQNEPYDFAKVSLGALAARLGLDVTSAHRATEDCLTTLAAYKKLVTSIRY